MSRNTTNIIIQSSGIVYTYRKVPQTHQGGCHFDTIGADLRLSNMNKENNKTILHYLMINFIHKNKINNYFYLIIFTSCKLLLLFYI